MKTKMYETTPFMKGPILAAMMGIVIAALISPAFVPVTTVMYIVVTLGFGASLGYAAILEHFAADMFNRAERQRVVIIKLTQALESGEKISQKILEKQGTKEGK
jgi:hypothetical protein